MVYTDSFKAKMVQRMSAPQAISAMSLSKEVGVSQSQLSRWLRAAPNLVAMTKERASEHVVQSGSSRTAAEKLRVVMAAAALAPGELGAFLRREGVHEAELEQWRCAVLDAGQAALESGGPKASTRGTDGKRIKELERELRRKDKALAEAAALLVLQKKSGTSGGTRTTTPTRGTGNDPRFGRRGCDGRRTPRTSVDVLGLTERSMQRWRRADVGDDGRMGPRTRPENALTSAERAKVLEVVNSPG